MRRLIASFRYAFAGLSYLVRTQPNARIHLTIAAAVVVVGLWLGLPPQTWAILALTVGLVLATEAFNTALEALADLTHPAPHPLVKAAKDVSAAAVLLTAIAAVVVGLLTLGPPLWHRLFS